MKEKSKDLGPLSKCSLFWMSFYAEVVRLWYVMIDCVAWDSIRCIHCFHFKSPRDILYHDGRFFYHPKCRSRAKSWI